MAPYDKAAELMNCFWQIKDISLIQWLTAALFIGAGIFMRRLLARGVIFLVKRFSKNDSPLRDELLLSLLKPISFIIVILAFYFAGVVLSFPPALNGFFNKVLNSLITFTLFWAIYCLIDPLDSRAKEAKLFKSKLSGEMYFVVFRLIKIFIAILGLMTILELWNVNVFAFVASLGLIGMAIALAAQNTLKNLFGSITILMDHALKKGDWIKTSDVEGIIENIGFRATVIRQSDKALVTVPNAKLAEAALINFSKMPYRLIRFEMGLDYKTTASQLESITEKIRKYLVQNSELETDPTKVHTVVRVEALTPSSIDILCHFFTKTVHWVEYTRIKEKCLLDIMKIVGKEGATFAVPSFYPEGVTLTSSKKKK